MQLPLGQHSALVTTASSLLWLFLFWITIVSTSCPLVSAGLFRCLTNVNCIGGDVHLCTPKLRNCTYGCLSRRYTKPDGALLAQRFECSPEYSTGRVDKVDEVRYCRTRPDCNDPRALESANIRANSGAKKGLFISCIDYTNRSRICSREQPLCQTLVQASGARAAGCASDTLQLYELVNTSRITRYAMTQRVCWTDLCTGTPETKLLEGSVESTSSAPTSPSSRMPSVETEEENQSTSCLRELLQSQGRASKSEATSKNGSSAEDRRRALVSCVRQFWLDTQKSAPTGAGNGGGSRRGETGNGGSNVSDTEGASSSEKGRTGDVLLKVLAATTCLLALILAGLVGRSLVAGRQRRRQRRRLAGDEDCSAGGPKCQQRSRRELKLPRQVQQAPISAVQFPSPPGSPTGSAVTTVTLPRRAVQLLMHLDEQMQQLQQQDQQQQMLHQQQFFHCSPVTPVHPVVYSPFQTAIHTCRHTQPVCHHGPQGLPTLGPGTDILVGVSDQADGEDEDTFV